MGSNFFSDFKLHYASDLEIHYKFLQVYALYETVLIFANSDILVNLLRSNGLFLYFFEL